MGADRPLAGVRVLDFGLLTAGANTSAMLADLGADVIKVESAAYLDPFRVVGKSDDAPGWWNRSPQFRFTNRNKRGVALNLKDPEGRRLIRDLAAHCDVVVENFRRGVLDRFGLGYADLRAINPRIVVAAISSQGDTGPERMNVSFGSTLDATSGIAALTGYDGEEPRISGMDVNYPDQVVSLFATGVIIAAIVEAQRTGKGAFLDVSQREVASFLIGEEILAASADPARHEARRTGNAEDGMFLQDCWRSGDGRWIAVTVADAAMAASCARTVGVTSDASTASLREALARWIADRPADDAVHALLAGGVAAAPSNDGTHLIADRRLAGVTLAWTEDGGLAKGLPYALDERGLTIERNGPDLGQHTEEILRDLLGLSPSEIARLHDAGVTSVTPQVGDV
jgi:crotonobetainyl-CoA:carnitine CoA-transferase CaiB-like acyl-CoA transferase